LLAAIEMIEAGRADQLVVAYSIGWCARSRSSWR
jgi:hypothetical protein